MRTHCRILALIFLGFFAVSATATAGEPFGRLAPYWRTPTPYYIGNPKVIQPRTNAYARMGQYSNKIPSGPQAYPYGFFGARVRPDASRSFGYYESYSQTSVNFGY